MHTLLEIVLTNALVATGLALLALLARLCRRPALTHSLWLLVLLKLVTPPLYTMPVHWASTVHANTDSEPVVQTAALPQSSSPEIVETMSSTVSGLALPPFHLSPNAEDSPLDQPPAGAPVANEVSPAPPAATTTGTAAVSWEALGVAIWLGGGSLWFLLAALSIYRFRRVLRYAQPAPAAVRMLAAKLAAGLGLPYCPAIAFVPGAVSPMLWAAGGKPRLLLPAGLFRRLSEEQQATLLAHELAHLRRRDHWVRALELLVTGLFWWHPVVWLARRELREAEEQCCDAWVLWLLPTAARSYADALLETVDFLSDRQLVLPATASGLGHGHHLRRRLTMIMCGTRPRALSPTALLAVFTMAALLLPLRPIWAQTEASPAERRHPDIGKAEDLQALRADLEQAKAQVDVHRAQLELAQAALQKAEANLKQAVARLRALEDQNKRVQAIRDLTMPIPEKGADGERKAPQADRLAELEKKIDALRAELEALRRPTGDGSNAPRERIKTAFPTDVRQLWVSQGHSLAVSSVAWSPDGKLAATASYDSTVRLWDGATGKEIQLLKGHDAKVQCVAFSPDGRYLLSGGYDNQVILWDVSSGKEIRRLQGAHPALPIAGDASRIKGVAFSSDGKVALSGGEDGYVRIWEVATGKEIAHLITYSPIQTLAFAPNGRWAVVGCFDGTLHLWDFASGDKETKIQAHNGWVLRVVIAPDGRTLVSCGEDGAIHLFDVTTGKTLRTIKGHAAKVESVAVSPDGRLLASAGFDKSIRIWDWQTGRALAEMNVHHGPVLAVAFSPDGKRLLSGSDDATLRLWSISQ
jgi:beta-lactamase regulating signal transducer with metallopeptidase domain